MDIINFKVILTQNIIHLKLVSGRTVPTAAAAPTPQHAAKLDSVSPRHQGLQKRPRLASRHGLTSAGPGQRLSQPGSPTTTVGPPPLLCGALGGGRLG